MATPSSSRLAFALLVPLALLATATAHHPCTPTTTRSIDTGDTAAGRFYFLPECQFVSIGFGQGCPGETFFSVWIYEESNGIDGLQRDDEVVDDTCHGLIDGDTIIF